MTTHDLALDSSASDSQVVVQLPETDAPLHNSDGNESPVTWDAPNWAQENESRDTEPQPEPVPPAQEPVGYEYRRGNGIALLTSMAFHTTLLLILACWVFTAGRNTKGLLLTADNSDPVQTSVEETESFELSYDATEEHVYEDVEPEYKLDMQLENPFEQADKGDTSATLTSISKEDILRELKPSGKKRGASFFGAYAEGNRFIYVLDSSRSMTGERWAYACTQLLDSLGGLKPGQEFYVICFDADTTFLFNKPPSAARYYEASNENIQKVRNWLRSRILGRATMPATALQYALRFDPDAIFLLSDGELQDDSRFMLRKLNNTTFSERRIPIHTVHLFSAMGELTLKEIAKENGGTFTPIRNSRRFGNFRR